MKETKLLTPTEIASLQEVQEMFRTAYNDLMTNRRRDAEERKAHIADLKAMGLWEGGE